MIKNVVFVGFPNQWVEIFRCFAVQYCQKSSITTFAEIRETSKPIDVSNIYLKHSLRKEKYDACNVNLAHCCHHIYIP